MTRCNWRKHLNLSKLFQKHTKEDNNVMDVEKKAKRDFKRLNDFIEKASKTANYEFTWNYEDITIKYQYETIKVDLGRTSYFNLLSIGEVDLVLRSLLKIYDLHERGLLKTVVIKDWTIYGKQFVHLRAFLNDWRINNASGCFRYVCDEDPYVIKSTGIINWLIGCIQHTIYTEGEYWTRKTMEDDIEMNDLSTDNVRIFNKVGDFCKAFYDEELTFVSNADDFKIMLFSKDKHTKYISIAGYNGSQVNVTFHEATFVIELAEVMNIVSVMRRLLNVSYTGGEYGVDFNYKSYPDDMLSYIKFLLGNTPEKYVECFNKFKELEQEEDKYLYELYERAYLFLGKWLDYAEKWQEQHAFDNYYTDDKGQDMFSKFESLDDYREQVYALGFCYHNIEKYLVRAGRKTTDPTEDINKALDYLHEYRKLQKIYFE